MGRKTTFVIFFIIFFTLSAGAAHAVKNRLPSFLQFINNSCFVEPYTVGLQAGHWKYDELPDEFQSIRETGQGTDGGGVMERDLNLKIAQLTAEILRKDNIKVEILPATIPPSYKTDVFVSIHSDGNEDETFSGFKAAAPDNDKTGKAKELVQDLTNNYLAETKMKRDTHITENMTEYYAFNTERIHTVNPETVSAIVETGFMTNKEDLNFLLHHTDVSAMGLARGIKQFLTECRNI